MYKYKSSTLAQEKGPLLLKGRKFILGLAYLFTAKAKTIFRITLNSWRWFSVFLFLITEKDL